MSAGPAKNPSVVTRFAPSPTGFLHIGGARTALFNWLFARHNGGQFQLRIEDTDRVRSTKEAIDAIIDGMRWLGLDWDGDITYQFERAPRHTEVAEELLKAGKAYKCFATAEELEAMRAEQRAKKQPQRYDGRWRDRDPSEAPAGAPYVVRLKADQEGETTLHDLVQGDVTVKNAELDDMILLRSDGTPTYMLAVVVDDHDMGVNHVIRGDDHLNNTFRQLGIIRAMNWDAPQYAHIPLIHGADGAKLSKRHGALGVEAYRDDFGYLPEAICNYLLRLGWGHGDDEIITREQAIEWFDLTSVGRSPSRFDFKKLENINGHYIREADDQRLTDLVKPRVEKTLEHALSSSEQALLLQAMPFLKSRAKNLNELAENSLFLFEKRPLKLEEKAAKQLENTSGSLLAILRKTLGDLPAWDSESLEKALHDVAEQADLKMGKVAQPLRAALTGRTVSPGIFDVMILLGQDESLARLDDQLSLSPTHS
ncbi:glutamate--tRNA ligase [Zymomonas sp.]|uniref:glutamate--tRNA ligase n=1 Tax=Zymomonas sp. TaxID=2068624 RepID=UPI0025E3AB98|nr:glutamate--tRNA ligase [Zymomonas sp.]MCA1956031.1 glutamate--tRNA ligase [Zymomonas sp.]